MTAPDISALNLFKEQINVLLLGPYGICRPDIISIKDYLISRGFDNSRLVDELPEIPNIPQIPRPTYYLEKSKIYIKDWGRIILYYFTNKCNCNSVHAELNYMCNNVVTKCSSASIIMDRDHQLGTLVKGLATQRRIPVYEFDNDEERNELSFSACYYTCDILYRA